MGTVIREETDSCICMYTYKHAYTHAYMQICICVCIIKTFKREYIGSETERKEENKTTHPKNVNLSTHKDTMPKLIISYAHSTHPKRYRNTH